MPPLKIIMDAPPLRLLLEGIDDLLVIAII
jgi:hypothetical protein